MKNYVRGYFKFINENINVPTDDLTPNELSNLFSDWINDWYTKKIRTIETS